MNNPYLLSLFFILMTSGCFRPESLNENGAKDCCDCNHSRLDGNQGAGSIRGSLSLGRNPSAAGLDYDEKVSLSSLFIVDKNERHVSICQFYIGFNKSQVISVADGKLMHFLTQDGVFVYDNKKIAVKAGGLVCDESSGKYGHVRVRHMGVSAVSKDKLILVISYAKSALEDRAIMQSNFADSLIAKFPCEAGGFKHESFNNFP